MNLTSTSIKHKRYSHYGWTLKNESGEYINTLNQGELGVLLANSSHSSVVDIIAPNSGLDLNYIKELRIGTCDRQYFYDGLLLKSAEDNLGLRVCRDLPATGRENMLYLSERDNTIYRFMNMTWVPISGATSNWQDITVIDGGTANMPNING